MWEETLIFMLIYLGVLFILPNKIRETILSNGLLCTMIIIGFLAGPYGILMYSSISEGFDVDRSDLNKCPTRGCATKPSCCNLDNPGTPYCLVNEKRLPTSDIDQTVIFNIYGRYVRVYPPETGGDGHCLLSQVVVNNAAGTNIALNQAATATGTHPAATRNPASVVDGTLTPRTWPNIWHSASANRATDYWQVDLGSRQMIATVRIMVESNVSPGRTTGLRVVVQENLAAEMEVISEKRLVNPDIDQTAEINASGRYVRIYARETGGDAYMNLTQVVVNNEAGTNIALNKTVTATSTLPGGKPPSGVVDGDITPRPWTQLWHNNSSDANRETDHLQIDLGSTQMISTIRIIGRGEPSPDRMTGLRIRVVRMIPNVGYSNGVCAGTPTPIYPSGTTDDEKTIIGPMILEGLNGQTALNIYRGIASRPSTFTAYGLTDSQSAAAAVEIRKNNLMAARRRGEVGDDSYSSDLNSLRQIKSMAGINFNLSDQLLIYMNASVINKNRLDANGNKTKDLISDGGKENTTKTIMNVLRSKSNDPSSGFSLATVANANVDIPTPPDTGKWAQDALKSMPQTRQPISIPQSGPTTITVNMTPAQKEAAVRANNPNMIVITPEMTDAQKNAAIQTAYTAQNVVTPASVPLTKEQMAPIASSTSSGQGFSSPNTSYAAGGQGQWYARKVYVGYSDAANKCAEYNGRLATLEQIRTAQTNGASHTGEGWYADSSTEVAWPIASGLQKVAARPGNYFINCYGPKPPPGTTDVAPWTDTAKTIPGGPSYTAGDWSQRIGGDGGSAKNADNTIKNPGTPLTTQEVYYVGGAQSLSADQATTLCRNLGGRLARNEEFQAAKSAGANWCGRGRLSNSNPAQAGTGCPAANSDGAHCFGIKPSMNSTGSKVASVSSSNSGVSFAVEVLPFNTTADTTSWSQTGQDNAVNCRPGQTSTDCVINGVTKKTCLDNGKTCAIKCPNGKATTKINGEDKCPE